MHLKFPQLSKSALYTIFATVQGGALFFLFLYLAFPVNTETYHPTNLNSIVVSEPLLAEAAVIYDPATKEVLYAKNAELTRPLASLTKLMTAHVVLDTIDTKQVVTLSSKDVSVEGDAGDWGLKVGDTMRIGDIIKLGLAASSNHAMSAAAAALGSEYINDLNKTASDLGLSHTYFLNPTGLDESLETSGAYGSALDVARLTASFMREYPEYFEVSNKASVTIPVSGKPVTAKATTVPLLDIPGIIGAKTGFTDLAGGNLVVAYDVDVGRPLIAVVLGSSQAGRFSDMRTLIEASRNSI
jgi:D-alanyl-D-alanine carboxypeptidase